MPVFIMLSAFYYLLGADMEGRADSHKIVCLEASCAVYEACEASSEAGLVNKAANADAVYFEVVS